tara:strand:- start:61 stop:303 length:243 start_codon:yes stop_codon:yes gene_type:complete
MTPFEDTALSILNAICKRLDQIESDIKFLKDAELGYVDSEYLFGDDDITLSKDSLDRLMNDILGKDETPKAENIIEFPKT